MIPRADVTGLILCGGAGRRFAGRDKPLERLAGIPLVEHVRNRLLPQVGRVLISCNRNFEAYGRWNDTIVADSTADRGPLGGVLAGLQRADTEYVFACPGDAPFLSATLVGRLTSALHDTADIAIPSDGVRNQHLFPLLRRTLEGTLRAYLDGGGRSVHAFIERQHAVIVDAASERDAFFNVNSSTDLQAATAILDRLSSDSGH